MKNNAKLKVWIETIICSGIWIRLWKFMIRTLLIAVRSRDIARFSNSMGSYVQKPEFIAIPFFL
jgi:hypothetical protein